MPDTSTPRFHFSDLTVLFLLGLAEVAVHTVFNGQYGFHRDELDLLVNARQLDCG